MHKNSLAFVTVALCLFPGIIYADDAYQFSGAASLGLLGVTDHDKSAKFQEYRDLTSGALGEAEVDVYKNSSF